MTGCPITLVEHHASQAVCASSGETRGAIDKTFVADGNLQEVFGKSPGLKIVVIGLTDTSQETHWPRPAKLKAKHGEHEPFSLENLVHGVTIIDHINNLLDRGAVDLLILGSKEESSCADQLKLSYRDNLDGQKAIDIVDREEQSFWQQLEAMMDLDHPVDKD